MVKDELLFLSNKELQNAINGARKLIDNMGLKRETQAMTMNERKWDNDSRGSVGGL